MLHKCQHTNTASGTGWQNNGQVSVTSQFHGQV